MFINFRFQTAANESKKKKNDFDEVKIEKFQKKINNNKKIKSVKNPSTFDLISFQTSKDIWFHFGIDLVCCWFEKRWFFLAHSDILQRVHF